MLAHRGPAAIDLLCCRMTRRSLLLILALLLGCGAALALGPAASSPNAAPLVFLGDRHLAPYEFESGGAPTGSNVDVVLAIGQVLGRPVEVRLYEWSQAQQRYRDGEGDVLMPLGRTPEREKWLAYTRPAVTHSYSLFVRTDDNPPLDPKRLDGVRIAVAAGGFPAQRLARQHPEAVLRNVDNLAVGTRALLTREVDALAAPTAPQLYLLQQRGLRGVTQLPPFYSARHGFGVRQGDVATLAAVDGAIEKLEADGELDRIADRWTRERVFLFSGYTVRMGQIAAGITLLSLLGFAGATLLMVRQRRRLRIEVVERREAEALARRGEERIARLQRTSAAINGADGMGEICEIVCAAGLEALSASHAVVAAFEPAGEIDDSGVGARGALRVVHRSDGAEAAFARWNHDAHALLARVAGEGRGVFADDPEALLELVGPPAGLASEDKPCAVAALPLSAPTEEGAPIGALALWFTRECDLDDEVRSFIVALADLAARAIDRARLLEQLRASLAASAVADRRKDEFLAMLGHELRNPLSPIVSAVELLARAGDRAAVREQTVDVIRRQVRQMIRLVDELLELSRIRHGLIELQLERVDLVAIARDALEAVRASAEAKSLALAARWPNEPVFVEADGGRLQQIVINLLTNAVRYTPEGGRVEIGVEAGDGCARLEVRDNGIGIEAEFLPRVFELFTQGTQGGTRRSGGGLGLGLALVKQLVVLHGGSVEARSEGSGRGAAFVVSLPTGPG